MYSCLGTHVFSLNRSTCLLNADTYNFLEQEGTSARKEYMFYCSAGIDLRWSIKLLFLCNSSACFPVPQDCMSSLRISKTHVLGYPRLARTCFEENIACVVARQEHINKKACCLVQQDSVCSRSARAIRFVHHK